VFFVRLYDATVAGYLIWAVSIAAGFMLTGLIVVEMSTGQGLASLFSEFLSQIVILALAVTVGKVVRSRQALAAETAIRLQLAEEERVAEAARVVAEERLRIARELHDTVAHSMATITVQAGSALHLLDSDSPGPRLRTALTAIRETSNGALTEMRSVLGQLRRSEPGEHHAPADAAGQTGLDRLEALRDAVTAAGAPVTVTVEGDRRPLSAEADHSAYRILQESLTNVLRHAGPGAAAHVCLRYQPDALTITVTDDGRANGNGAGDPGVVPADGHGIDGMRERAASLGGELTAGPLPGGGFQARGTMGYASYTTMAQGFGPGFDAPLIVAARVTPTDHAALDSLRGAIEATPGIAAVTPPVISRDGRAAVLIAYPTTGEQDAATNALVNRLEGTVLPRSGLTAYLTGPNAANVAFTNLIGERLPWLIGVVVALSMVLLLVVFRSVVIAVKAALMNLLSVCAAYGVLVAVTQWGWLGHLFGFPEPMPVTTWVPVFLFVILFGLSMDYEVFLSFDLTPDVSVKQIGLGLAAAVLVDATVVRLVLVPAVMELLGKANWWLPGWLDRLLPARRADSLPADGEPMAVTSAAAR
jgi:signal transduction histidine kinase